MLEQPYWLLKHPVFKFTPFPERNHLGHLLYSLCSTYVTYRTPCYAIDHKVLPTQPLPREAEDFPRGGKYPKDVRLPTCLDYLEPV